MNDTVLSAKHRQHGLYLEEYSDHLLFLKSSLGVIASFMQASVNPGEITKAADKYLLEIDAK